MKRAARLSTILLSALILASCSGGGTVPSPPVPTLAPGGGTGKASITLSFAIGAVGGAAVRAASYVSPKTKSIGIYVTTVGGTAPVPPIGATIADVGSGASSCTTAGTTITCTLSVTLPAGSVGLSIRTFPTAGAQGPPLSIGDTIVTVVAGQTVNAPVNLLPVVALAFTSLSPSSLPGNQPGTATLTVSAKDSAGDVIGGTDPYYLPITVVTDDTGGHVSAQPALPAKITAPGQHITFTYDGLSTANAFLYRFATDGNAIVDPIPGATGALTLTQGGEFVYVSTLAADAVYVYAAGPSGSNAPVRVIGGTNTTIAKPIAVAVDKFGAVYVVNYQRDVTVFAPGANGNVAPILTFGGGTGHPESIELLNGEDPVTTGRTVVSDYSTARIEFYNSIYLAPPLRGGATSESAMYPGMAAIATSPVNGQECWAADPIYDNPSTQCNNVPSDGHNFSVPQSTSYGLTFRADGLLAVGRLPSYSSYYSAVLTYDIPASSSNYTNYLTAKYDLHGPATQIDTPYQIAFDKAGNMYVANAGSSSGGGRITVYAPNATGDTAPLRTIGGFTTSTGVAVGP
ncbi:MAG: hypothetical protein M3R30_01540 [Candidatus Eremiobacteraeota bacterium]|nr:hypothetical protein [Candidatus Eremiobacteraeota bacterium]